MYQAPVVFHPCKPQTSDPDPVAGSRVELQLLTTLRCNLKCTYCSIAEGEVLGSQGDVGVGLEIYL